VVGRRGSLVGVGRDFGVGYSEHRPRSEEAGHRMSRPVGLGLFSGLA
jgi:hypothetical protein